MVEQPPGSKPSPHTSLPHCAHAASPSPPADAMVQGLDIGCGTNLIYCLLGSAVYGWRMVGSGELIVMWWGYKAVMLQFSVAGSPCHSHHSLLHPLCASGLKRRIAAQGTRATLCLRSLPYTSPLQTAHSAAVPALSLCAQVGVGVTDVALEWAPQLVAHINHSRPLRLFAQVGVDVTDVALEWAERHIQRNPHLQHLLEVRQPVQVSGCCCCMQERCSQVGLRIVVSPLCAPPHHYC